MANMSTYAEKYVLNMFFRGGAHDAFAACYCGLVDDSGTDVEMEAGTLTNEITTYTGNRKAVTFGAPADVAGKETIKNSAAIEFLVMPAVTVKYAIVSDAATAGNILYWCPLTAEKAVNAGDTFKLNVDGLVLDAA